MSWDYKHLELLASSHHGLKEFPASRNIWRINPTAPALVLGSAQNPAVVDALALRADGIELVKRRTGGGIVYLHPKHFLWLDITIPATDPLFKKDTTKASLWLGELLSDTLLEFKIAAEVYRGAYTAGAAKGLVCFSSRAPGELLVDSAKILGISQRHTKYGIWFQTLLLFQWDSNLFLQYLRLSIEQRQALKADLDKSAGTVKLNPDSFVQVFLSRITARYP